MTKEKSRVTFHDYSEDPVKIAAEKFQKKGYVIANCAGIREPNNYKLIRDGSVGILDPRNRVRGRTAHIGTLWFEDGKRGAIKDKNWVLEVYGRQYVSQLTELVEEISEPSGLSVQVKLREEEARPECLTSDLGW